MLDAHDKIAGIGDGARGLDAVANIAQQLAEREQTDQHRQKGKTLPERVNAEIKAGDAVDLVLADCGDEHTERSRDNSFEQRVAGEAGGDRQRKKHQRKVVPGTELEADTGQSRSERHQ